MSRRGTKHLSQELEALVNRFRLEYKMTYAEVIGCLELIKADLVEEAQDAAD